MKKVATHFALVERFLFLVTIFLAEHLFSPQKRLWWPQETPFLQNHQFSSSGSGPHWTTVCTRPVCSLCQRHWWHWRFLGGAGGGIWWQRWQVLQKICNGRCPHRMAGRNPRVWAVWGTEWPQQTSRLQEGSFIQVWGVCVTVTVPSACRGSADVVPKCLSTAAGGWATGGNTSARGGGLEETVFPF